MVRTKMDKRWTQLVTFFWFAHPENSVMYSVGSKGKKIVFFFESSPFTFGVICFHEMGTAAFCALFRRQSLLRVLKRLTIG